MISPINRRYKSVHASTDNRVLNISKANGKAHTCSKLQSINLSNLAQSSKRERKKNAGISEYCVCI